MKLPIYKVLKVSLKKPMTLEAEWIKEDLVICEDCRHCIDGICTNAFGMLEHGVDKDDFCSRGERL